MFLLFFVNLEVTGGRAGCFGAADIAHALEATKRFQHIFDTGSHERPCAIILRFFLTPDDFRVFVFRKFGFQLALVRPPRAGEAKVLLDTLEKFRSFYAEHKDAAGELLKQGESTRDYKLGAAELASYTGVASLIFNLDEMVTKE